MTRWVYDVETDDLLVGCTRMWILCAYNLDTEKLHYWLEGDLSWQEEFSKATLVAGFNSLKFDNLVLEKLFNFKFPETCQMRDLQIISLVLDFNRFGKDVPHSLKNWGKHLGFDKLDFDAFHEYSEEMLDYAKRDVMLTVMVNNVLLKELTEAMKKAPLLQTYIKAEYAVAEWVGRAEWHGWPFDKEAAIELSGKLDVEMKKAEDALTSILGMKAVAVDKVGDVVEVKEPKYTLQGFYHAHTASWFGVEPVEGLLEPWERPVSGPYCRVTFEHLSLSSPADVKIFLFRHGWIPTEWNYKKDPNTGRRTKEKSTPKITEDSLELLGENGKLYPAYLTARSRSGILRTWIEVVDENGRLHGDSFTIGTPSMRTRHNIIANVPTGDSPWGREMRSLFTALPGYKLIGCDSEGNQARGLAHYLGDPTFTHTLLNKDIHTFNATLLDKVLSEIGFNWSAYLIKEGKAQLPKRVQKFLESKSLTKEDYFKSNRKRRYHDKAIATAKRAVAKRILYAFLFGAAGLKLWSYVTDVGDSVRGNKLKLGFTKAVPGFQGLIDRLGNIYGSTKKFGDGYIYSIAGNKIYVDSFHKLLVYLLQSLEKITCSAALMLTMKGLKEAGIPYIPCIMYHDEIDFMVPEQYATQAAAIGKQAFVDGPKLFGVMIMGGSGKIGNNWYDVH